MLSIERTPHSHPIFHAEIVPHTDLVSHSPPMTTQPPQIKKLFVVGGPAGCGKTTVASYLSQELGIPYLEGDDVRPVTHRQELC